MRFITELINNAKFKPVGSKNPGRRKRDYEQKHIDGKKFYTTALDLSKQNLTNDTLPDFSEYVNLEWLGLNYNQLTDESKKYVNELRARGVTVYV